MMFCMRGTNLMRQETEIQKTGISNQKKPVFNENQSKINHDMYTLRDTQT